MCSNYVSVLLNFWKACGLREININLQYTVVPEHNRQHNSWGCDIEAAVASRAPSPRCITDQRRGLHPENRGAPYSPQFQLEDPLSQNTAVSHSVRLLFANMNPETSLWKKKG